MLLLYLPAFENKKYTAYDHFHRNGLYGEILTKITGLLIFRAVTEPRISTKSAKFTKTREIPRNSLEILPNTCRHNIFESYLGCWGCLLAVNLLIVTAASKQHPKTTRRS